MSADQKASYRPAPITQRDGSKLATSNCRMASIATGLDYDTLGKKKSSGAKMRAHQLDQEGGTDAGDAKLAWSRGYDEVLDVQDGNSWDQALADLRAHRMVHLDVWHATTGGPCLSGTGRYGHTIAVLPDCADNAWLVADPWCSPPRWVRVSEAKLKAGAEEWGRRVYGAATSGPGRDWKKNPPTLDELRAAAKELMTRFHAGGNVDTSEDPGDTGGGQRVMYTATEAQSGGDDMVKFTPMNDVAGQLTTIRNTAGIPIEGGERPSVAAGISRPALGLFSLDDLDDRVCYLMGVGAQLCFIAAEDVDFVPDDQDSGSGDCAAEVTKAVDARDDEWREWALDGAPGQRTVGATKEE